MALIGSSGETTEQLQSLPGHRLHLTLDIDFYSHYSSAYLPRGSDSRQGKLTMDQVVYNGDTRYPGPKPHPPPAFIKGIPSQQELDAYPRMFTWGELKEIIRESQCAPPWCSGVEGHLKERRGKNVLKLILQRRGSWSG